MRKTAAQLDREIAQTEPIAKEDLFTRSTIDSNRRQKAMHQALLTWPALIVTGPRGRKTLLIQSGEMSNPEEGSRRVTMFLSDGPEGHIARKSITRLAQDLSRDLFPTKIEPATEDQVMRWMSTPEYMEGADRVLEMQRRNREGTSHATVKRAKKVRETVHIVGLRDGIHTAGTALYLRKMRALGATVTLTKTGRVTVRDASGKITVYTVDAPQNRAQADALLARDPDPESPLSRAYADLIQQRAR